MKKKRAKVGAAASPGRAKKTRRELRGSLNLAVGPPCERAAERALPREVPFPPDETRARYPDLRQDKPSHKKFEPEEGTRRSLPKKNLATVVFCKPGVCKTVMILPQVHLRKPCYDFYFL